VNGVIILAQGSEPSFVRVEYDIGAAVKGIEDSDLPHEFADQLRTGGADPPKD
jgi:hypothetical protein